MAGHRWSGWPGAWCLDCGIEDPNEIALADGNLIFADPGDEDQRCHIDPAKRHLYGSDECPEPGSKRNDPYMTTYNAPVLHVLAEVRRCAASWAPEVRLLGNVRAADIVRACDEAIKRLK